MSYLDKKVNFCNAYVPYQDKFVIFVYNGNDPHQVKNYFDQAKQFEGLVVHFPKEHEISWPSYETAERKEKGPIPWGKGESR